MSKFFLSVFNHFSVKGVEDYIHYLKHILLSGGHELCLTNLKPSSHLTNRSNSINLISLIIEFAESDDIYEGIDFDSTFIIATEYIGESGFNQFLAMDKDFDIFLSKIPSFVLRRFLLLARKANDLRKKRPSLLSNFLLIGCIIRLVLTSPRLSFLFLIHFSKGFSLQELAYRISLSLRFRCFIRYASRFKGIIVPSMALHNNYSERLAFDANIIYLPPLVPLSKIQSLSFKDVKIFFSGRLTQYRSLVLNSLTNCFDLYNLSDDQASVDSSFNNFRMVNIIKPENVKTVDCLTHELYVGQSRDWIYASPMRTYRSLRMGYIPVSDKEYINELFQISVLPFLDDPDSLLAKLVLYNESVLCICKSALIRIVSA